MTIDATSEREILDRVDQTLRHLDRLLDARLMDQGTYNHAAIAIAVWEERARLEIEVKAR